MSQTASPTTTAYERLCRWRDIGDGPVDYTAGSKEFGNDVSRVLGCHAGLVAAGNHLIEHLDARMKEASKSGLPIPVFDGFVALRTALAKATGSAS